MMPKDHLQDDHSSRTSFPQNLAQGENTNDGIMHPSSECFPAGRAREPSLHDSLEHSFPSVLYDTSSRQDVENSLGSRPTSGNLRKSSRIQGLHPQYLGVGSRDKPTLNPLYEENN